MKKLSVLFLILICFTQCISSPNTNSVSEKKVSKTQNTKPVDIQKNQSNTSVLQADDTTYSQEEITKIDNKIYNIEDIEVAPEFPGGINKFYKFMNFNTKYPDEELNVKGEVFVTFVIEKDGLLTDIEVLSDAGYGTGTEAIRVLKKCPRWNPGKINNEDVRVFYSATLPIK
jgi:protein TonB